jgi:hypothetical protein
MSAVAGEALTFLSAGLFFTFILVVAKFIEKGLGIDEVLETRPEKSSGTDGGR